MSDIIQLFEICAIENYGERYSIKLYVNRFISYISLFIMMKHYKGMSGSYCVSTIFI
jgi:hypothetical protein